MSAVVKPLNKFNGNSIKMSIKFFMELENIPKFVYKHKISEISK